jgi:AcrR family transcriptional regulator
MGRKSLKEDQQKKIVEAFYKVARHEGIENVSFGRIAKELDMHQSLVVHYFSNKEEMLLGLIDFIIAGYQNIYQSEEGHDDPMDKLKDVLNNIFSRRWNSYVDDSIFYNCYALIYRNDVILTRFRELHQLLRKWLESLIKTCMEQNQLDCESAEEAADIIFVISDGAYYYLGMINDDKLYHKHLERYKREAFKVLGM